MSKTLSEAELRVLGVLMEKSLMQPGSYPLTANAITQGSNQKQNRDPIVDYTEAQVLQILQHLESKGLVEHASPASGARVHRFAHRVVDEFRWDRYERAIMAELMLRERQTAGELRTHASRMVSFEDLPAVARTLQALMAHDPPYVEELPREPGRSANRFRHLLSADKPAPAPARDDAAGDLRASEADDSMAAFSTRLTKLETRVAELSNAIDRLQGQASGSDDAPHHHPTSMTEQ